MSIVNCLTPARKIVFGIFLLICVNFLWVLSSEVSHFIYVTDNYNKPFFTTYLKTALFSVYLLGFFFSEPWRVQCRRDSSGGGSYFALQRGIKGLLHGCWLIYYGPCEGRHFDQWKNFCMAEPSYASTQRASSDDEALYKLETSEDRAIPGDDSDDDTYSPHPLGDPCFEPIRIQCTPPSSLSGGSSCSSGDSTPLQGRVKFSSLVEVRSLSDSEDSRIARMSYAQGVLYKRHRSSFSTQLGQPPHAHKLSLTETMRVALTFSILWFLGSWAYAEALCLTQPSVVNIISATSGIFVCILAALFPSSIHDNFTFSKFAAAFISVVGVVLITMAPGSYSDHNSNNSSASNVPHKNQVIVSDSPNHHQSSLGNFQDFLGSSSSESVGTITSSQLGVLWALMGAFGYAVYLVTLKHQVGSEENIDIPMFFGFVGLFTTFVMGPGLYVFHVLNWERFELPDLSTSGVITINGLLGTVLSEFLWLWGCFLTSSLAGTLSLSMTTPMTMLADVLFRGQKFSWHLYVGSVPIVFSFFAVTTLQQYNNWDPIGDILFRAVTTSRTARTTPTTSSGGGAGASTSQSSSNVKTRKPIRGATKLKRAAKVLKKPVDATSDLFNTVISKTNPSNSKLKVEDDNDDRDALLQEDTVVLPVSPSDSLQSLSSQ